MTVPYPTPRDLVRGLNSGEPAAREQLGSLLQTSIRRLLEGLARDWNLRYEPEGMTGRALRLAEIYLRARPDQETQSRTWGAFLGELLFHLGRVLIPRPGPPDAPPRASVPALPSCPTYEFEAFYRPYERVGDMLFGGDWFAARHDHDSALWVLLADVSGHGYYAYILASALPDLWRMAWARAERACEPADVLTILHELLESVLPVGIFVEGMLLKLLPGGEVIVHPAGGARILLRRSGQTVPERHEFKGCLLGIMPPFAADRQELQLDPGDELLLTTDGLYDQLEGHRGQPLTAHLATSSSDGLFESMSTLASDSLAVGPQKDDITLLLLRRRSSARTSREVSSTRAADVPV